MKLTSADLHCLHQQACHAALLAGQIINAGADKVIDVQHKQSGQSLAAQVFTEIDLASERCIIDALSSSLDRYELGLLTEESTDNLSRFNHDYFWCIDPLDGTLAFVQGQQGYAVSIALVARSGEAVIGVVYDPANDQLYSAILDEGLWLNGEPWSLAVHHQVSPTSLLLSCDHSVKNNTKWPAVVKALEPVAYYFGAQKIEVAEPAGAVMNAMRALQSPLACYFKHPKPQAGGGSVWDFAATLCIYQTAGAIVTDFSGQMLHLNPTGTTFMNQCGVMFATHLDLARQLRITL